jgi:hypothetical protein
MLYQICFHFLLLNSGFVQRTLYNVHFSEIHRSQHDMPSFGHVGILIDPL